MAILCVCSSKIDSILGGSQTNYFVEDIRSSVRLGLWQVKLERGGGVEEIIIVNGGGGPRLTHDRPGIGSFDTAERPHLPPRGTNNNPGNIELIS